MTFDLSGRNAIVTGASQGLGLAIARAYVEAGASVAICARDESSLNTAVSELRSVARESQRIIARRADVAEETDVAAFVDFALRELGRVDILVNNAGIYGPLGAIEDVDWAAWVRAIEINLMGSVLFCRALLPHFKQNRRGKIIQLSGGGATNPLPRISAYAASKAAIVRFAETLAEEVREWGIDVNSIAPGALNTRLLDEVLAAGPDRVGENFYNRSVKQKESGGAGLQKGTELALFLASTASDGVTGKLISAVWDPFPEFPEHADDLRKTDVYTLRRIVPKDRGLKWGLD
ncbi:MAG TPA: SDR family oxidoreductase [Thermoanaerobaculia bacterium]|jgi:NAD(P)-dependent dehydrogenase (short-subunit alcohol dehydrogenase family)